MDKNTLVGFALIGAVVIGFSIYNRPSQEEMARAKHYQDSIQAIAQKEAAMQEQAAQQSAAYTKRGRTTGTGCHGTESECNIAFRLYLYVLWRKPRCGTANDTGK